MKRTFYIFLMMIFFVMLISSLYFCIIYGLVMNHVIPTRSIIPFTDIALSPLVFSFWIFISMYGGYHFGVKWWQIIYVDKVYYFGREKKVKRKVRSTKSEG